MDKELISIIVPIYNIQNYLSLCLDSIINQSYRNIEIILVDDGSTDNSGKICDDYSKIDDRIKVIHKKNGGLSDARNTGLEIVTGDYIGFVDGDDFIHKDMYNIMIDQLKKCDADVSICKFKRFSNHNNRQIIQSYQFDLINNENKIRSKCVSNEEALRECLLTNNYSVSAWSKLYKRTIFDKLRYPKGLEMEDWAIIVDVLLQCNKVVLIENELYYYYKRQNSIMLGKFKDTDLLLEKIFIRNVKLVDEYFPRLHNYVRTNLTANYFYVIDKMIQSCVVDCYKHEFDDIVTKLFNEIGFIFFKSKHRFIRKVSYLFLLINKKLYIHIIKNFY